MSKKHVILIIDDESQIRRILRITLESADYKVIEAANGKDGIVQAATSRPSLIMLDLGLPDQDGLSVLREIRAWSSLPVMILSVRNTEEDIVTALDLGADDYVTKPFNSSELLARIRANIRRTQQVESESFVINGDLKIDFVKRVVYKKSNELKLTNTEYLLLFLLFKNIDKVLTHNYVLKEVWGPSHTEDSQYLRVFIAQIRKKIEDDASHPKYIVTESGVGYRMKLLNN
ncbi:MAG: response regulator [Melioribacter sp.]|nr:response regulator [Melioribacter sp.]